MVNLALVGIGRWGLNYIKIASSLKGCKIKYLCAQTKQTLDSYSDQYIKTTDFRDFFDINDIDGIIIATPGSTHFKIAKEFLSRGFNLLIEKPLTTNYAEALELQKIWYLKKPIVLIGHIQLYNPAYQKIKRIVKTLGKISSLSFEGLLSPKREDISVIWDWGPHPISLCLDLMKQTAVEVYCKAIANKEDSLYHTAQINLLFASQVNALIKVSWLGDNKRRIFSINGTEGKITFDDSKSEQKISVYRVGQINPEYPKYDNELSLIKEVKEFIKTVEGKGKVVSDINLGVEVTSILSAAEESARNDGKLIKL